MGASSSPDSSTSHPAPCLCPGESSRGRPKVLGPCIRVGDPEEVIGSWIRIGTASAIALTYGLNHGTENLPLCLSSYLYI